MTYVLRVSLTNEDKGYVFSDFDEELENGWTLDDDGKPDFGHIYKLSQGEYGRCVSSVYVDREGRKPARIGWYFVKRNHYDQEDGTYLQGAWVTVAERVITPTRYTNLEIGT